MPIGRRSLANRGDLALSSARTARGCSGRWMPNSRPPRGRTRAPSGMSAADQQTFVLIACSFVRSISARACAARVVEHRKRAGGVGREAERSASRRVRSNCTRVAVRQARCRSARSPMRKLLTRERRRRWSRAPCMPARRFKIGEPEPLRRVVDQRAARHSGGGRCRRGVRRAPRPRRRASQLRPIARCSRPLALRRDRRVRRLLHAVVAEREPAVDERRLQTRRVEALEPRHRRDEPASTAGRSAASSAAADARCTIASSRSSKSVADRRPRRATSRACSRAGGRACVASSSATFSVIAAFSMAATS